VNQLYSIGLAENMAMRALAKAVGMSASRDPSSRHEIVYSLTL
jgi:hypothetical protein